MVFNIQRKDLNPSQIKRSNKIMGASLTFIFALFSLISFGSGTTGSIPGPALGVFYIAMIVIAFLYVKKNIDKRNSMIVVALFVTLGYATMIFTHD